MMKMDYAERICLLRETKMRHTREKFARHGHMDGDDLGSIAPPPDFHWDIIPNHPDGSYHGPQGWATNFRALMEVHPVYVNPLDALAGRWMFNLWGLCPRHIRPEDDYPHLQAEQELYGLVPGIGAPQHFAPDYTIGLVLGWGGLLRKVRHYRACHGPEKAEFYQALEDLILGTQTWIRRHVAAIREAAATETRPELQTNLEAMAECNEWLIENPARNLREVCQWIAWFAMVSRTFNGDGAGCRLDLLLEPYYERDLAAGLIDDETTIFYLACLLLADTHYYQLSGPLPDGRDGTNQVSFLALEAAHRLRIACNLTVRVHAGIDQKFFHQAVRHLVEDRQGWPRFAGDQALVAGFMKNGFSAADARQRIAVGCHWMALPGREFTLNDCVKINVAKVFAVALQEMLQEEPTPSVAVLWQQFESHLRRAVLCTARGLDWHLDHARDNGPELMIDLLCHGPVEQGLDATDGGVEFYNMCVDGSGLATVADSFAALEQRIERDGVLTWPELQQHLRDDYAGPEGERVRLMLKNTPRYGRGGALGDEWADRISKLFTHLVKESPTPGGRNMIPGWFSWSNTISMGRALGATPNGRHAGTPISHGANPDPGFRSDSAPTAMASAIAAIQPGWGNTAPMQLDLDPGVSHEAGGVERVASLIKTHFDLGGTLCNINVLDKDTLLAAHADPTQFPDLVVRVTGFTAFFANLSPDFRQLVVDRFIAE